MRIGFSIMPPWEVTQATHAFISGWARVVSVEEVRKTVSIAWASARITHLKPSGRT
jgi:beta-xylosidase